MATEIDAAREGRITFARITELQLDPVRGRFDVDHLREVHRRIFQDLTHHAPGDFRPDAPGHMKRRVLESTRFRYAVPYALRPEVDARLTEVLTTLDGGAALRGLPPAEFTGRMARLYGDLDHLHPFREGNSRTLRSFTDQLARQAGYSLDWGTTNANAVTRDNLYMARDFAVLQRAYPGIAGKEPTDIADRDQYAAYLTLGELQKADRLGEIIRQSVDRGRMGAEVETLAFFDVKSEMEMLLPAARHQARWDEERARILALRTPSLAPLHEEAAKRHRWIDGAAGPENLLARGAAAGVTSVDVKRVPGERAIERVIGLGSAVADAERALVRDRAAAATDLASRRPPSHRER
ncbi:fido (protein-threonine AMPylation protein) [Sphingomonas vulcanisoli]|uniref:protein adenylyltransferase n=1 Tax=Sphingomonas vulcanisoli TaxID=1658060 RepID=A0ABX0U0B1_9SPHN|nr:fido (protein-threonine AMPylation protein) [Sphingomonas vulcanisoli]